MMSVRKQLPNTVILRIGLAINYVSDRLCRDRDQKLRNHALVGHLLQSTAALDALNRNPRTKSLTFSADISLGLRDALPDPERCRLKLIKRFRLKLTMSVPANSRANRLLRRSSSDGEGSHHIPSLGDPLAVTLRESLLAPPRNQHSPSTNAPFRREKQMFIPPR